MLKAMSDINKNKINPITKHKGGKVGDKVWRDSLCNAGGDGYSGLFDVGRLCRAVSSTLETVSPQCAFFISIRCFLGESSIDPYVQKNEVKCICEFVLLF